MKKMYMIWMMILMLVITGCNKADDIDNQEVTDDVVENQQALETDDEVIVEDIEVDTVDEPETVSDDSAEVPIEDIETPDENVEEVGDKTPEDVVFIEDVYKIGIPYIAFVADGYGVVLDGQAVTDMDYDYMTYVQGGPFVEAQKDGQYALIDLENLTVSELMSRDAFTALVSEVVYASEIVPFQDEVTGLWGYMHNDVVVQDAIYGQAGYFIDGYGVVFDNNAYVYHLMDEDMRILITSDSDIRNLGYGIVGVADDMMYMAGFEPFRLMDMNNGGTVISNTYVFEADVVTDYMILVSDHLEHWLINRNGEKVDTEFSTLPGAYFAYANVVGNKLYFSKDSGFQVGDLVICDMEGHHLMNTFEMTPSGLESLGDDVYAEIHHYVQERYTDITLPQLSVSGDYTRFEAVNDEIRMLFGVDDYMPSPLEEVWEVYDVSYSITVFGDVGRIMFTEYWYGFGAAHGNYGDYAIHVNLKTGEIYHLGDLFADPEAGYAFLEDEVQDMIDASPDEYLVDHVDINEDSNFIITEDGFRLFFNPYEIGPYAAGIVTLEIPLERFKELLDLESPLMQHMIN